MILSVGVLGVSGYTGQELIRILANHPHFKIKGLYSTSIVGPYLNTLFNKEQGALPDVDPFQVDKCDALDVLFLAVPHTKAMPIVADIIPLYPNLKIIDLSADFRLSSAETYESYYSVKHVLNDQLTNFVYGLPELYRDQLKSAKYCANPGCYATSIILGTIPLKPVFEDTAPIVIDAKSGVSGAGKSLKESSLYCEVNETLSAYSTGKHRHVAELEQEVGFTNVMFSPHLVPMDRGIESAIYMVNDSISENELYDLFANYYEDHPFVVVHQPDVDPSTKLVNHTNYCSIIPKKLGSWVVVFSLLDNLVKGASGQAVQNANLMVGFEETAGLI